MSAMTIDNRSTVNRETADQIDDAGTAEFEAQDEDGRMDRKTRRRYLRLIRRVSGCPWVTCHMREHSTCNDGLATIAFGRAIQ